MDFRSFAEAYRPEVPENPWARTQLAPAELIEMHDFLARFGQRLYRRLQSGALMPPADARRLSDLYVSRALSLDTVVHQHHERVLASISETPTVPDLDRNQRVLADFVRETTEGLPPDRAERYEEEPLLTVDQQHYARILSGGVWTVQMFGHTQSQWHAILTGGALHPDASLRSQIGLANNASVTIEHRRRLYAAQALYLPAVEPLRQAITGNLAEADALITLLSVARTEPGLTVLPAPPQFEAYAGAANADFLVFDVPRAQVIGVQVKSFEAYKSREHYDPDRIVLVDASLDLFGTLSRRTHLGRSDTSTRSWPGQVTGHFLDSLDIPRPPWPWLNRRELAESRQRVQPLVAEARNRNHEAEEIVRERVLTALGR
ncbi:hypothetical protein BHE97_07255 [Aeromicrobium sp. PE09-221]|uniref:hypothetical protein n=1 Tax=Aeromicrobium sp. PE09-221 TaxID=1898043 RepID=UPI000B3E68B4|nr:hypothetical protein [Aeromicrobium sp. PE09-221]OUZ10546.1 hypothetical protein BHE97_07255 [Aeromicrobium sp. PE09-221]